MSHLTESEIIAKLKEAFRLASGYSDALAVLPMRGVTYDALRKELALAEGCCRSIAYYRGDSRWFRLGMMMEETHKRAGTWLRTFPVTTTSNEAHPLFLKLADNLRAGMRKCEDLETRATGRVGMILPVHSAPSASGLILPVDYGL